VVSTPLKNIILSNWESSPNRDEHKKYLKPPGRKLLLLYTQTNYIQSLLNTFPEKSINMLDIPWTILHPFPTHFHAFPGAKEDNDRTFSAIEVDPSSTCQPRNLDQSLWSIGRFKLFNSENLGQKKRMNIKQNNHPFGYFC